MMNTRHSLAALIALAALLGCGGPDDGPPPLVKTQATVDAQIEKIKQDPNMTPEAKEGAIRAIQSSFDASKRNAQNMKQKVPK
jgi:predicted small lipoprotein YifL